MVKFKGLISFVTGTSNEDEDSKDYVWGLYPNDENAYFYAPNGVTRNAQIMTTLPF